MNAYERRMEARRLRRNTTDAIRIAAASMSAERLLQVYEGYFPLSKPRFEGGWYFVNGVRRSRNQMETSIRRYWAALHERELGE